MRIRSRLKKSYQVLGVVQAIAKPLRKRCNKRSESAANLPLHLQSVLPAAAAAVATGEVTAHISTTKLKSSNEHKRPLQALTISNSHTNCKLTAQSPKTKVRVVFARWKR